VGLFVLAVQLNSFYDLDFTTAWYAASLVPYTVVAGQGAAILFVPLMVALALTLSVSYFVARAELRSVQARERGVPDNRVAEERSEEEELRAERHDATEESTEWVSRPIRISLRIVVWLTLVGALFLAASYAAEYLGVTWFSFVLLFSLPAVAFGWMGGRRAGKDYVTSLSQNPPEDGAVEDDRRSVSDSLESNKGRPDLEALLEEGGWRTISGLTAWFVRGGVVWRGVMDRWVFKGLALAYTGLVVSTIVVVVIHTWLHAHVGPEPSPDPVGTVGEGLQTLANQDLASLPTAHICVSSGDVITGLMLSHSDENWHVIPQGNTDQDALRVIPNQEVQDVDIY
jgi:hypothetical protein